MNRQDASAPENILIPKSSNTFWTRTQRNRAERLLLGETISLSSCSKIDNVYWAAM